MPTPNIKEIEWAISELEQQESSEARYTLLAALYTCRDNMSGDKAILRREGYSAASTPEEPLGLYGDSEFLREVSGKPPKAAWSIMDELMDSLQVVNPRVYDNVMRKMAKA